MGFTLSCSYGKKNPAPAAFAIEIRQNPTPARFGKSKSGTTFFQPDIHGIGIGSLFQ